MSYSIGPFLGKPAALIAAFKKQVEGYSPGASRDEAEAAAAFVIPQLEKADPSRPTVASASGSAGNGYVTHNVSIGMLSGFAFSPPQLVE